MSSHLFSLENLSVFVPLFSKGQSLPFLLGTLFSKCHKMAEITESWRPREASFAYLITKERRKIIPKAFEQF